MNTRPKPGETDDDLIRQNAEFLKKTKRKAEESGENLEDDWKKQKSQECGNDCIFSDPEAILKQAKLPGVMLCDIFEKETSLQPIKPPTASSSGFPQTFKRDKTILKSNAKKSVFALMQQKKSEMLLEVTEKVNLGAQEAIKNVFGPSEAQQIHEESMQKISQLTEDQILEEQQRLLASLNPDTLKFFANRGPSRNKILPVVEEIESLMPTPKAQLPQESVPLKEEPMSIEDFPIGPEDAKKWLHMDVVETEKLKWMKKLPKPNPVAAGDPYPARFDFEGNLLPANSDIPVTEALHHHGEEPERPGYTLEELLLFSRSSVMQQRAIGINTLANILRLAKEGRFDLCLEESIIPQLIGAGIFAILRFSLDDSVTMVVQAASEALSYLLASEPDEVCLALTLGTKFGLNQPILACTPEEEKEKGEEPVEEGELRDHELLQLDVIKGALRTDLIPRIRYLLEIIKPAPKTVLAHLEILTRVSRHSRESALAVGRCPGLMKIIMQNFLPSCWESTTKKPAEMSSVLGVPLVKAVRLVRVIASQSKAMATDFVLKYSIMQPVLKYLASEPGETGIPDGAAILLESIYLWQTLISYGLAIPEFNSFSPVFGRLLSFHLTNTNLRAEGNFYQEHATALLSLLQTVLKMSKTHSVNEELICELWIPIFRTTASWVSQAAESFPLSFSDFKLVGTALDTSSILFQILLNWESVDAIDILNLVETVLKSSVIPLAHSNVFAKMTSRLHEHSSLLHAESISGRRRDPNGLPSAGAVTLGQKITSVLQPDAPFYFLQPLIFFINLTVEKFHKTKPFLLEAMSQNVGVQTYLGQVAKDGCPGHDHWFSRVEVHLVADLLSLSGKFENMDQSHGMVLHRAALNLVPCIRSEDKNYLADIFRTWVFFDYTRSHEMSSVRLMEQLQINEKQISHSQIPLAFNDLSIIRDVYLSQFGLLQASTPVAVQPNTISMPVEGQSMVPVDWPFVPLVRVVGQTTAAKESANAVSVHRGLQWVLILETMQPDVLNKMLTPTARFCRLACIFLADNGLFLEDSIHNYLQAVLLVMLQNMAKTGQDFDFDEKIPGLKDFWDLYVQLVQQYSAESYGDKLFAHFVFIPLQQRFKVAFKNLIWGEQVEVIRFLSLPLEELLIPIERFIEPVETGEALLTLYLKNLRSGLVKPQWSPVLYKVATHHLIEYVRNGENAQLVAKLKAGLSSMPELTALLN